MSLPSIKKGPRDSVLQPLMTRVLKDQTDKEGWGDFKRWAYNLVDRGYTVQHGQSGSPERGARRKLKRRIKVLNRVINRNRGKMYGKLMRERLGPILHSYRQQLEVFNEA